MQAHKTIENYWTVQLQKVECNKFYIYNFKKNGFVEILIFIEFELIDRCCRLYF